LLNEPSRLAHALNAIGLCAKIDIIFGVNPMFLVNVSRVGFESAGTCSGFRAVVLGIVVFLKLLVSLIEESPCVNHPAAYFVPKSWVEAGQAFK
jgi:hypothetical protein